jgi:hypothetical protein
MQLRVHKRTRVIVVILAGCVFFGIAMGLRGCFDNMWMRAGVAAVGAAGGLAIATLLTCQKGRGD